MWCGGHVVLRDTGAPRVHSPQAAGSMLGQRVGADRTATADIQKPDTQPTTTHNKQTGRAERKMKVRLIYVRCVMCVCMSVSKEVEDLVIHPMPT